ncbi:MULTISPECIES: hypothetical protein [Klebsiella/Raoultella group]|uniref:hypothetical protein n=1 Tax=Klebsiella/Raoultella group TaxID=2890311 RepID=UPI0012B77A7B|nr:MULTISPECIES: hypothetical protein [Klebsiella/Raoultella group]MCF6713153.1 hypothetical protein [Raoultella ornithinolytica]
MQYEINNIESYDNVNGKATSATVRILTDDYQPVMNIFVKIPLEWENTLSQTREALINKAKAMLKKVESEM